MFVDDIQISSHKHFNKRSDYMTKRIIPLCKGGAESLRCCVATSLDQAGGFLLIMLICVVSKIHKIPRSPKAHCFAMKLKGHYSL